MKCVRVFLFVVCGFNIALVSMDAPPSAYKPLSIIEAKVKNISFITPCIFAISTPLSPQLILYELKSKKPKAAIKCDGPVNSISQCDNFKKIAAACYDIVYIFDIQTGQQVQRYKTNSQRVNSVHAHPNGENIFVSGAQNKTVKVWDLRSPIVKQIYSEHEDAVTMVRASGNKSYFVSSSEDKTTKIWDWNSIESHHTIRNVSPKDITYNSQGNTFMTCTYYAYRYDALSAALLATFNRTGTKEVRGSKIKDTSALYSCASTGVDDHELLAIGTDDGKMVLFNPENSKALPTVVQAFASPLDALAFCPNGNCLVAGSSKEQKVQVYELSNKKDSPILSKRVSLKNSCIP